MRSIVPQVAIALFLGAAGVVAAPELPRLLASVSCDIKGNVSITSGERIYHVPGQKYYLETRIRPEFGERMFCSEAEARAAGWRKSGI